MRKLLKDNYQAVVARGLITAETTNRDFLRKVNEEIGETHKALYLLEHEKENNLAEEITDFINVGNNWLINLGFDPDEELKKCLVKNLKRVKDEG